MSRALVEILYKAQSMRPKKCFVRRAGVATFILGEKGTNETPDKETKMVNQMMTITRLIL